MYNLLSAECLSLSGKPKTFQMSWNKKELASSIFASEIHFKNLRPNSDTAKDFCALQHLLAYISHSVQEDRQERCKMLPSILSITACYIVKWTAAMQKVSHTAGPVADNSVNEVKGKLVKALTKNARNFNLECLILHEPCD